MSHSLYENKTLSPLPSFLHHGLAAVSFFGFFSFLATFTLLVYLTYRLIRWRKIAGPQDGYNQFILLIYNLVFADLQQSIAFLINSRWAARDALEVGTSACFAQGWFISVGQLGTGIWILAIAVHTFAAVVLDYKVGQAKFALAIVILWVFNYTMAIIGVAAHPNDIYERAGAWVRRRRSVGELADIISAGSTKSMRRFVSGSTTFGSSFPCSPQ